MDNPQFPEYGDGGDYIGARRMRRAFRWCAAVIFLFTAMLWFSEHFLRYNHAERLYLAALTKQPEAGRNFLRQAVVHDRESKDMPNPKYVEALAEREESDLVLPTYEEAFSLDPNDATLAIRYGCRLFIEGQMTSARQKFRTAAELAPKNLLPVYLEASVMPWLDTENEDLDPAMALVVRANGTPGAVTFPKPLWSPSLPQSGYWYAHLRRNVVDECSQPLYRFSGFVFEHADLDITAGNLQPWEERLAAMHRMGTLIARGALDTEVPHNPQLSAGGALQAYLGLSIIGRAVEQEKRLVAKTGEKPEEDLDELAVEVEQGKKEIQSFEARRQDIVAGELEKYRFPIRICLKTLAFITGWYLLLYLICKILHVSSTSHNVQHSRAGRFALGLWAATVLGILTLLAMIQHATVGEMPGQRALSILWWTLATCFVVFGLIYPRFRLVSVAHAVEEARSRGRESVSEHDARRGYRAAYLSLARRYLGIMFGVTLSAVCIWAIAYRIAIGVYPWEVELLAVGLRGEELELVRQVIAILG